MELERLQRQLETIYGVCINYSVDDFLITDAAIARRLDTSQNAREVKEKLLISQDGDNLDISLYIDAEVIDHLAQENPFDELHDGNLTDFWIAMEGVSHFLYLTWNAFFRKQVTLLELEMQAEVDKFISSVCLFRQQKAGQLPNKLRPFLFYTAVFDDALDEGSLARYKDANFYAGKYCFQLEEKFLKTENNPKNIFTELRHFYRLPQWEKISRIQSHTMGNVRV